MALVYHYCSPQSFLQIMESKKIWLSSTRNMNDSAEGKWFLNIVIKVLKEHEEELGKEWCENVKTELKYNYIPLYIACFSKNGDALSQWRSYAEDGFGVAIGFDEDILAPQGEILNTERSSDILAPKSIISLRDVDYKTYEDLKLNIFSLAEKWIRRVSDVKDSFYVQNTAIRPRESARYFSWWCIDDASALKNPAFCEEEEKRLILKPDYMRLEYLGLREESKFQKMKAMKALGGVKHRVSNGFLTSHFELPISGKMINTLILGPKNKFTQSDLNDFLLLNDMSHVKVKRSTATYR